MKRLQTDALWTEIDGYLADSFVPGDAALDAALEASEAAGLPPINVAPNQGKLLMLLAHAIGARRILEIGTLGGYSTIWLARGLAPGGKLITLDANPKCAEVARANIARAGFGEMVEIRVGKAIDTLPGLASELPSTSSSSMPTSKARPAISNGRSSLRAKARSSSSTMSCAKARSSIRPARIRAFKACAASSSSPPPTRA